MWRAWLLGSLMAVMASGAYAGEKLNVSEVAPDVFAVTGENAQPDHSNAGNVINTGFIIGPSGVIVIDTGPNFKHGQALLAEIHRHTDKPVAMVINTRPAPEYVLGNSAFSGTSILAWKRTAELMKERCTSCQARLTGLVGADAMAGTKIVVPNQTMDASPLHLTVAGRKLTLLHFGEGATEGDLSVLDDQSRVLFTGPLVDLDRVPDLHEATTKAWIASLNQLAKEPFDVMVPDHGPVAKASRLPEMQHYLDELLKKVSAERKSGKTVLDALHDISMPDYQNWAYYKLNQETNIQHLWFELEKEDPGW